MAPQARPDNTNEASQTTNVPHDALSHHSNEENMNSKTNPANSPESQQCGKDTEATTSRPPFDSVPDEILAHIIAQLGFNSDTDTAADDDDDDDEGDNTGSWPGTSTRDYRALTLVSRRFRRLATPRLYGRLTFVLLSNDDHVDHGDGGGIGLAQLPLLHRTLRDDGDDGELRGLCRVVSVTQISREDAAPRAYKDVATMLGEVVAWCRRVRRLEVVEVVATSKDRVGGGDLDVWPMGLEEEEEEEGEEVGDQSAFCAALLPALRSLGELEAVVLASQVYCGMQWVSVLENLTSKKLEYVTISGAWATESEESLAKLRTFANTSTFHHLSIRHPLMSLQILKTIIEWSPNLTHFDIMMPSGLNWGWDLSAIQDCLLPRASTLQGLHLGSRKLTVIHEDGLSGGFDLRRFPSLAEVTLSASYTGLNTENVEVLLGPELLQLNWSCPCVFSANNQGAYVDWCRAVAECAVRKRDTKTNGSGCKLESIHIGIPSWDVNERKEFVEDFKKLQEEFEKLGLLVCLCP